MSTEATVEAANSYSCNNYAVQIASYMAPPMSTSEEKNLRKKLTEISTSIKDDVLIVTPLELMKVAHTSIPSVREFISLLCKHYSPADSFYKLTTLFSVLSWFNRKCLHQDALISCVSSLEYVTETEFVEYIKEEVMSKLSDRLDRRSLQTCFENQALVGVFFPLGGVNCVQLPLKSVLSSGILDEIDCGIAKSFKRDDYEHDNWFSIQNANFMICAYRNLDSDQMGMLSENQLFNLNRSCFNPLFIAGVFRTQPTYVCENEQFPRLDYRGFCVLNRAVRYMSTLVPSVKSSKAILEKPCIRYVFDCLDLDGCGYLDRSTLLFIVRSLLNHASTICELNIDEEVLTDEVFDIVNPEDCLRITLNDFYNCTRANTVLGLLIDVGRLCAYENRENEDE